jgi:hypothetical protein
MLLTVLACRLAKEQNLFLKVKNSVFCSVAKLHYGIDSKGGEAWNET